MKKTTLLYSLLSCSTFGFAQNKVETVVLRSEGSQPTLGNQTSSNQYPSTYNPTQYWNHLLNGRSAYDGDAVSETRMSNKSNHVTVVSNNGSSVNVSYGVSTINPTSTAFNQLIKKATQAFVDKKYVECIDLCDNMLGLNRLSAEAYFLKGAANFGLDKKEISLKFFKIAKDLGSEDAEYVLQKMSK